MRLRSPILARMPSTRIKLSESAGRVSLRVLIGGPILAILVILVLIVHFRLLSTENPLGIFLYGIHDQVFLPIKGYGYTRFFPESLTWWGIALTALTLIVLSLLTDRSLIKGPHIGLLRFCMRRPSLHNYVIQGSLFLHRAGIQPQLVRAVAWREWEAANIELRNQPLGAASRPQCRRLSALTRFNMQLDRDFEDRSLSHLRMLETWQKAYLTVFVYGNSSHLGLLNEAFWEVDNAQFGLFDVDNYGPAQVFEPSILLRDAGLLHQLGMGHSNSNPSAGEQIAAAYLEHREVLVEMIETRRRNVFDAATLRLERGLGLSLSDDEISALYQPLELATSREALPILSRIALNITLLTAYLTNMPHLGLAYVESLEALDLMLASAGSDTPAVAKLRALMQEQIDSDENAYRYIPLSEAYRLLAQLAKNSIEAQEDQWEQVLIQDDSPIDRRVFRDMRVEAAALYQAAGPATANDSEAHDLYENGR